MKAQAVLLQAAPYLDELEERLRRASARHPGVVARVGADALDAGGKRLRPLLVHLTSNDRERALRGGVAVELVHTATLVHDDVIDGAELRRGREAVWHAHGAGAARAAGDYLFAGAFGELAAAGDLEGVRILADTCLALARGEALQRSQLHDPETTEEAYFERIALKSGKLFEAACLLGSRDERLGRFGLALGIAFQIVDDILDCTGDFDTTGKAPGVDLRDGTPTLPLILAAREDRAVRRALAGQDVPDARERVVASGALEEARGYALEYAEQARGALDGEPDRDSLEALTHAVVDREA
jgi:geranylgeranyl pyrophosphate synthase